MDYLSTLLRNVASYARQSVAELSKDIDFSNHPGPPSGDGSYVALINRLLAPIVTRSDRLNRWFFVFWSAPQTVGCGAYDRASRTGAGKRHRPVTAGNPRDHLSTNRVMTATIRIAFLLALVLFATTARGDRPNILFIIVDDQSPFDLKVYNPASTIDTPNIDRLAAEGMVFDGAYHMGSWSGAVCTPSRHMIMTGRTRLAHSRSAQPIATETAGPRCWSRRTWPSCDNSMPAVFNRAGYDTMRTCKKGNSYEAANKLFTVRHDATKRGGTDENRQRLARRAGAGLSRTSASNQGQRSVLDLLRFLASARHPRRHAGVAGEVRRGQSQGPQHACRPPTPKQPPLPVNYLPAHPFHHGHPGLRDEVKVSGVWKKRDERTIRNELGREFACSENIDIQIGRVLKKLEAMGELDNTYVFYTADHGMAIGRHGLQGKAESVRTHLARPVHRQRSRHQARAVGRRATSTCSTCWPRSATWPAIEHPQTIEGISFKPVLEGKQETVRDVLYGVYCGGTKPGMRCVRKGDWKLIKYDVLDGEVRETQLFNLKHNPHEFLAQHANADVVGHTGNQPSAQQVRPRRGSASTPISWPKWKHCCCRR